MAWVRSHIGKSRRKRNSSKKRKSKRRRIGKKSLLRSMYTIGKWWLKFIIFCLYKYK